MTGGKDQSQCPNHIEQPSRNHPNCHTKTPTATTLTKTANHIKNTNGCFTVLCRNTRRPTNAPGQPPKTQSPSSVRSEIRHRPSRAARLSNQNATNAATEASTISTVTIARTSSISGTTTPNRVPNHLIFRHNRFSARQRFDRLTNPAQTTPLTPKPALEKTLLAPALSNLEKAQLLPHRTNRLHLNNNPLGPRHELRPALMPPPT